MDSEMYRGCVEMFELYMTWIFQAVHTLPNGLTKEAVSGKSVYDKIEILECLASNREFVKRVEVFPEKRKLFPGIRGFLAGINKEDFRSFDDLHRTRQVA